MFKELLELARRSQSVIAYLVFGVLTTAVNVVSYWFCTRALNLTTMPSTVIAWVLAVSFAYVTNRRWVFHSEEHGFAGIFSEIVRFFSARLATGVVDWLCMYLFVDVFKFDDLIIKVVTNVIVIILNYVASKLVVFRSSKQTDA